MAKAISMNDTMAIKLTLRQAHMFKSVLCTASYDLRKINKRESELLGELEQIIREHITSLDYSENEKIVDDINARIAKEADE